MKIGRFTIKWNSFSWATKENHKKWGLIHPQAIDYGIWWFNWLAKDIRYWGYEEAWYDGPLPSFGFWFFNISWVLPWSWTYKGSSTPI